jgi:Spy/CpxP family protein refolding chaperone
MKKILSTALAIVLFVGASQAQTTEDKGHHRDGQRQEKAFDQLNLTPEQKAKFQSLREAQKNEMEALRKQGNVTPEQRKAIHEKYKSQYEAILTPAQKEQFSKQREEWKDKGGKGENRVERNGGKMGKDAAFFSKELNLTADQQTKLQGIFQEFRTKAQGLRSNTSLSQEQKHSQMQSLAQQYMAQGKAVLTPEQARKFDELKSKRFNKRNGNV